MSSWSTNGRHNAIVADAIVAYGLAGTKSVHEVYEQLMMENELSQFANYEGRHGTSLEEQRAERYAYVPGGEVAPADIHSLARSYYYQSCEHDTFADGWAGQTVTELMAVLAEQLGSDVIRGAWCVHTAAMQDERWAKDNAAWEAASMRAGSLVA